MTDFSIVEKYLDVESRATQLGLTVTPGHNSFLIQNKKLKILSMPTTIDGIGAYLDAVEYVCQPGFTTFDK